MRGSWPFLPVTMHVMLLTCAQDIQTDHCWPAEGRVGGGMPARDRCTHGHGTWRLVELHPSRTPAGSLWVFHIKRIADGSIERDTARRLSKVSHTGLGGIMLSLLHPVPDSPSCTNCMCLLHLGRQQQREGRCDNSCG